MGRKGEVEVTMGGHVYRGEWRVDGEDISLTSDLGSSVTRLGAGQAPEIVARILLRGIVVETGGHPD